MKDIEVKIPCEDFTLEGKWYCPETKGPSPAVIICHPHPLFGGNFRNNVVRAVYWELAKQGIAVLRFNFRGVGNSGGSFGGGVAEVRDVRAAINFALSQPGIDTESLGLVGYSFGGGVSVRETAGDNQVKVLALISPQLDELAWQMLEKNTKPKLFVVGSEDEQFPLVQYEANLKTVPEPKEFHIVKGADHYWAGYETELAGQVGRFFTENLKI